MPALSEILAQLESRVGAELGVSRWLTVDQHMIDQFAAVTLDDQWIHVDVARAERDSPFGSTVAHGYLTLSLIPYLRRDVPLVPDGARQTINYGADSVRFVHPVRAGARVRLRVRLDAVTPRGEHGVMLKTHNTVEIDGQDRPALVADLLTLAVY